MTVFYKQGVLGDLQQEARKGLGRVANLYKDKGKELHVTSLRDSNHGDGSLHYDGLAFDFRQDGVSLDQIKIALGVGWDVLLSNNGAIHAEYDPKPDPLFKSPMGPHGASIK